jgi:hypothetical protein
MRCRGGRKGQEAGLRRWDEVVDQADWTLWRVWGVEREGLGVGVGQRYGSRALMT